MSELGQPDRLAAVTAVEPVATADGSPDAARPAGTPPPGAEQTAPPLAPRHRVRRITSMVCVVLVAILLPTAALSLWATRTVLDASRFATTVRNVTSDPVVLTAVSRGLTDRAFVAVNGSAVVEQIPPALQRLVPLLEGALHGRVEQRVNDLLSSDAGQDLLNAAVKRAHAAALTLLEGGGLVSTNALSVNNGVVTLDLRPLIRQVLVDLQHDGVLPASIVIPAPGEPP